MLSHMRAHATTPSPRMQRPQKSKGNLAAIWLIIAAQNGLQRQPKPQNNRLDACYPRRTRREREGGRASSATTNVESIPISRLVRVAKRATLIRA